MYRLSSHQSHKNQKLVMQHATSLRLYPKGLKWLPAVNKGCQQLVLMPIDSQPRQPLLPPGLDLHVPDLQRDQPFSFTFLFFLVLSIFFLYSVAPRISASFIHRFMQLLVYAKTR